MPEIHNGREEKAITTDTIKNNIQQVQQKILDAAARTGQTEPITLVAVAKMQPVSAIDDAIAAGIRNIGENYVQEARTKVEHFGQSANWHLLGHLQGNKAKDAVRLFDLIQSVDSLALANRLSRAALDADGIQDVLLQVHLGDETTKFGLSLEEAIDVAAEVAALPSLQLHGLMGIAPHGVEPRPFFRQLQETYERLPAKNRQILSMGMTGDFETAIEEGATLVRIGTAIFGPRSISQT